MSSEGTSGATAINTVMEAPEESAQRAEKVARQPIAALRPSEDERAGYAGRIGPITRPVMPEQYYRRPLLHAATPGARLMHAVLEQAVYDLLRYRSTRECWLYQSYCDAFRWTLSRDRSHPFSFVNLCETLGYSPTAVRVRLLGVSFKPEPPPTVRARNPRRRADAALRVAAAAG